MEKNILIIAGEPSGDLHASKLAGELKSLLPETTLWGVGGDKMASRGVELVEHIKNFSMVGVWEVILKLAVIRKQFAHILSEVDARRPSLAILVDYPGFNLKIARELKKKGIPVAYYIIPQVWAWGKGRINQLRDFTDKALVLFEFEEKLMRENGVNCSFVGHPLLDDRYTGEKEILSPGAAIALLPGSRISEIEKLFPIMLDAAEKMNASRDNIRFIVAENSNIDEARYSAAYAAHPGLEIIRMKDRTQEALANADFALVTSGTATLEAAITGVPMIITYITSPVTAFLFFKFVRLPYIGLVNFIAGRKIVPELLQEDASPEQMASLALRTMDDPGQMRKIKDDLSQVKDSLGGPGASHRAARAIAEMLQEV
ncbi:MAG: lipid-A-disaccharide synthase [Candidatus Omnitrophica bacterium]|nr:lipid-A-disaccharide synthase [Candidatus Omnitrophota bacterium]